MDMDRSYFIKLTIALYKVTNGFPQREPLKFLIREKANTILGDLILSNRDSKQTNKILDNIESLLALFEVAESQKWVEKNNFIILQQEYNKIAEFIKNKLESIKKKTGAKQGKVSLEKEIPKKQVSLGNKRWEEILQILKQRQPLQVKDLQEVFPNVTKRTLRRDFEHLLQQGLVQRRGDKNDTEYVLR